MTAAAEPIAVNEPVLRWSARARSIADVEKELARIWAKQDLTTEVDGQPGRHVAARTSVMNLVVIARRPEIAERGAATIQALTGKHPSRTIVVQSADPDGPSWIDARVEAHCIMPREDAPETCAETIHLTAGGEAGRHLVAIVTPLVIHDLPVTVWWPGEPPFASRASLDLFKAADRLVVDGSTWNGDGLARLGELAATAETTEIAVSDFAMVRQSRWREAIASIFDDPDFLPYLRSLRRIAVTYATHDEIRRPGLDQPRQARVPRRVAGVASRDPRRQAAGARRGGRLDAGSRRRGPGRAARPAVSRGMAATLSDGRAEVADRDPSGRLADAVRDHPACRAAVRSAWVRAAGRRDRRGRNGPCPRLAGRRRVLERHFLAARRGDVDLLAEAIEAGRRDVVSAGTLRMAAKLVDGGSVTGGRA